MSECAEPRLEDAEGTYRTYIGGGALPPEAALV